MADAFAMDHCHVCGTRENLRPDAPDSKMESIRFAFSDSGIRLVCHDCLLQNGGIGTGNPEGLNN
jgi:hypothetical protein